MAAIGFASLVLAFISALVGAGALGTSAFLHARKDAASTAALFRTVGRACTYGSFAALLLCCLILVVAFFGSDNSIAYVVDYRSNSESALAPLYKLSGLWAGRQGSLLFWGWLISAFNLFMLLKTKDAPTRLDDLALGISQLIVAAFVGLLLFSADNAPFALMAASSFDAQGNLVNAELYGLNPLLEHWAMAVHPPTLFIGYAGLTLPFAYALATFICNDDSDAWVLRVNGVTAFSWLFLGIGLGLGAVWAYVVLGWGGYWGWDPVENASLLSWLACTSLMHSFTIYRTHGASKRWCVTAACLTFMFVIVATFITRSGIVQSVHAFASDQVSLVLFGALIAFAAGSALVTLFARRSTFGAASSEEDEGGFFSREMGYFLGNVVLMLSAFVLCYLTVCSALPAWLPLGGVSIQAGMYNMLARPISIVLLLVVALGPLFGWRSTDPKAFAKKALIPGIVALVAFAALFFYFVTTLIPVYGATIAGGGSAAEALMEQGPMFYYFALTLLGFLVACLLLFNSLFMCVRLIGAAREAKKEGGAWRDFTSGIGGMLAHAAMGLILVGLIGSGMYVTEHAGYLASGDDTGSTATDQFRCGSYTLAAAGSSIDNRGADGYLYTLDLDVVQGGQSIGQLSPSVQLDPATMQQYLHASVISTPGEDLFVSYKGVNSVGDYSIDVRVNRLISFVWVGWIAMMAGTAIGALAKRRSTADVERDGAPSAAEEA